MKDLSSTNKLRSLLNRLWHRQMQAILFAIVLVMFTISAAPAVAVSLSAQPQASFSSSTGRPVDAGLVEANKVIALRFAKEGWGTNPRWETVWDEIVADDVIYHFNSSPEPIIGLETNKAFNAALFAGFPDIHQTIETVVSEGNEVVYRSTIQGTNTGEFLGMPPTGKAVKLNDFTLLKVVNGKISEWWCECNLLELMNQLGIG